MKLRRFAVPLALACALAASASAGVSDASFQKARPILDAGIQAMGGLQALRGVQQVWRVGGGTAWAQGQSLKPDAPLETRKFEIKSLLDYAGRRSATETVTSGTGILTGRARSVLQGETGFNQNLVAGTFTPMAAGALTGARTAMRRDPAALLLTALSRAETLRSLGDTTIDGKAHKAVAFADSDGTQFTLVFEAAGGLLAKVETLADNPVLGDALTEVLYSEYRDAGAGVRLPSRAVTRVAGEVTQDLRYTELKVNAGADAAQFESPKDAVNVPAAPPASGVAVTKLSENAYWAAGGSHYSLLVALGDHVVVVEAPLNEERSLAVIAKAEELFPGKPIRYVVMSHYHFDHSGGLRTYVAKGVTVVTTPGNKAFVEKMAAAPHTIRPDAQEREKKKAVVETFTGKKVMSGGGQTLELHDVGPNGHAGEILVAYLPKEKALYVVDLLTIPAAGPWPRAAPALLDFDQKLKKLNLAVEQITPGHGRVGNLEDLKAAVAKGGND
jgi:glyoxylase-like metal-dependent hydrolase (beta-lactamase superfamily II)